MRINLSKKNVRSQKRDPLRTKNLNKSNLKRQKSIIIKKIREGLRLNSRQKYFKNLKMRLQALKMKIARACIRMGSSENRSEGLEPPLMIWVLIYLTQGIMSSIQMTQLRGCRNLFNTKRPSKKS
jgi:hypothetical protein